MKTYKAEVIDIKKTYCKLKIIGSDKGGFIHKRAIGLYLSYKKNDFVFIDDLRNFLNIGDILNVQVLLRKRGEHYNNGNSYIYKIDESEIDLEFKLWFIEQKNKKLKELKQNEYIEFIEGNNI